MAAKQSHLGKVKHGKDVLALNIIAYGFCGLMALICLVPFLMILAGSFSSESAIMKNGFSLLPQDFSLEAYRTVFREPMVVVRAYATTICLTIAGTLLGLALQTMTAYVLARKEFEWRNYFSFFFYFTTLFSGGLVPYYLLIRQTLHLVDSYLALLLPLLFSVYNLLIMKSYILGIPESLIDAAKIDGCGNGRFFVQIALPLSTPAFATIGFLMLVAKWNDWNTSLIYIRNQDLYTLQYLLQRILNETAFLKNLMQNSDMAALAAQVGGDVALLQHTGGLEGHHGGGSGHGGLAAIGI